MNIVMIDNDYNFCDKLGSFLKSNGDLNVIKSFNDIQDAIVFIEINKKILGLIMIDLEIQNLDSNIDTLLDVISKDCNIMAMSDNLETIEKYINYPYFQRVFKKPISFSAILNYISIQNKIETYENCKKGILKTLSKLGFNINHAGTTYLVEATALAIKTKLKKLSDVYTLIAYNHDTNPKIIGWSINNAINKTVKSCKADVIQDFFKIQSNQKLTAKYIISYFLHYYDSAEN